jgi:hypothetical protein
VTDHLVTYLDLADRICLASADVMAKASEHPVAEPNTRSGVLAALALKIDGAFRALVEDCRAARAEAMHHLKTMTEAYIYFYVVAKDTSPRTAERILADGVAAQELKRLDKFDRDAEKIRTWTEFRDAFRREADQLAHLEALAKGHSEALHGWYGRVYRLACQSSHIGDLLLWMPDEQKIRVGPKDARAQATIAIHYGLHIALDLLDFINQSNDIGLHVPTEDFRRSLESIRASDQPQEKP